MFSFNNTHIFTGYLKQLLSSVNIPTCKIYTKEFADFAAKEGIEDPRVIESVDNIDFGGKVTNSDESATRIATYVNYLKGNELYNYFWNLKSKPYWKHSVNYFFNSEKAAPGFTKTLHSPGRFYDVVTHEYLGEYLRFLRDYYNINLMSLYNCFNDSICTNLYYKQQNDQNISWIFDSADINNYKIYAIPVKLFADYTIAIDSWQGVEMFCGLYNTHLDTSDKGADLIAKTYKKVNKAIFKQPFLYDLLNVGKWPRNDIFDKSDPDKIDTKSITRWDIINREQDLRLFIKVPTSSRSSVVILEGDFRNYNDTKYSTPKADATMYRTSLIPIKSENDEFALKNALLTNNATAGWINQKREFNDISTDKQKLGEWQYQKNHTAINFENSVDLKEMPFKPIGKLQLLAYNTGTSYPFADRLVEYLCGSAITPIDSIPDNIKRAQEVMKQNGHYFKIEGLWEDKMQKIIYDYIINSNTNGKKLGHTNESMEYDLLGYVDRDAEKWYASQKTQNGKTVYDTIQNVDIYIDKNGKSLYEDF